MLVHVGALNGRGVHGFPVLGQRGGGDVGVFDVFIKGVADRGCQHLVGIGKPTGILQRTLQRITSPDFIGVPLVAAGKYLLFRLVDVLQRLVVVLAGKRPQQFKIEYVPLVGREIHVGFCVLI